MHKSLTRFLLVLAILVTGGKVLAADAVFRNGLLTLPVVEDDGDTWTLELELVADTFPPEFDLSYSRQVFAPVAVETPYLLDDVLVIPSLAVAAHTYWVELRLTAGDHFILDNYGPVNDAPSRPGNPALPDGPAFYGWVRVPGEARDIGVGADGTVWVLGANSYRNGGFDFFDAGADYDFGLFVLDEFGWLEFPGAGLRLDVDPDGYPWVVNSDQEIWRLTAFGWQRVPGWATDIGIGADGSVWVLGVDEQRGGYDVYRYTGLGWQEVHGTGVRIDVGPDGVPWVINHDDHIFRLRGDTWEELPGLAKDIGIGADGSVWVIGTNDRAGGYGIYTWDDDGWLKIRGSARQVSVGPDGNPWVVNRQGRIYTRH